MKLAFLAILCVPAFSQQALVTSNAGSTLRNNFTGWVGMAFTPSQTLTVTSLGRICVAGNSLLHSAEIVTAGNALVADVALNMAGCALGQYVYGAIGVAAVLSSGTTYYVVTQEAAGGDMWYDYASISWSTVGTVTGPVYSSGSSWIPVPDPGASYVPPNMLYTVGATVPVSSPNPSSNAGLLISLCSEQGVTVGWPLSLTAAGCAITVAPVAGAAGAPGATGAQGIQGVAGPAGQSGSGTIAPGQGLMATTNGWALDTGYALDRAMDQAGTDHTLIANSSQNPGVIFTASASPTLTVYTRNSSWNFTPDVTCLAGATINIDGLGPLVLKKISGGALVPVTGGECIAGASFPLTPVGSPVVNAMQIHP